MFRNVSVHGSSSQQHHLPLGRLDRCRRRRWGSLRMATIPPGRPATLARPNPVTINTKIKNAQETITENTIGGSGLSEVRLPY